MLSGVRAAGTGGSEPRGRLWLERVRLLVRWGAEARDAEARGSVPSGEELEPEIAHCGHILQCCFQFHKYFCIGRVSLGRWVRTSEVGDPPR